VAGLRLDTGTAVRKRRDAAPEYAIKEFTWVTSRAIGLSFHGRVEANLGRWLTRADFVKG